MASRVCLISSVISGILGFWTSAFILPKKVICEVNCLCSYILWHSIAGVPTGSKVAWTDLTIPKKEEGLGIKKVESWSDACGLKLIWMIFSRAGSIWVAWIRNRYLSSAPFWVLNERNYVYSWMFKWLLKLRQKSLRFLQIKIRNGDTTFFWWDPWIPFEILYHFLGSDGPSRLGNPLFATVSDVKRGDVWSLPNARSDKQVQLLTFISTLSLS